MLSFLNVKDSPQAELERSIPASDSGRLRIGKVPWHTGHDYELSKLPVDFLIVGDCHRQWATSQRPVPSNVRFVASEAAAAADLMILHVDQWILQELDKLKLFQRFLDLPTPKVILNHGCNMVDGCSSEAMRDLVGDHFVICNSSTAHRLWEIPNSIYIHHGMSPEEWPQTHYGRQNIVVTQPASGIHQSYRNNDAIVAFEKISGVKVDWVGRDFKFDSFDRYRAFLAKSSIYFNPSFASPNPRARTEAMLCGLVPVTTDSHGESQYIINGVNGFCSNDIEELYENLIYLKQNPLVCMVMGIEARKMAQREFHISRFAERWRGVIEQQIGRTFDA